MSGVSQGVCSGESQLLGAQSLAVLTLGAAPPFGEAIVGRKTHIYQDQRDLKNDASLIIKKWEQKNTIN